MNTATGRFGTVLTAMVSPFDQAGRLDPDGAATLARWLVAHANDGLVVTGTTGEAPVLSDAEKADLWRSVSEAVTVPVIAGTGTNDTAHSVELTKMAESCGVAGILAVCPYYNRPSQAGIEAHLRAVASATSLPVMVYDIPVRTGRRVATQTMLRLAREVDNIVAVKDASGDPAGSAALVAAAPPGFDLYSGDDSLTLPLLAIGAVGAVGVASHWTGPQYAEMVRAFRSGEVERARAINASLLEYFAFQTSEAAPNPIPAKALLRELGLPAGHCRLPHLEPPDLGLGARARKIIDALGLTGA